MKTSSTHKKEESLGHSVGSESAHAASDDGELHQCIAVRAYELYRERGYGDRHDLDDWLEAERTIVGSDATTGRSVLQ